MAGLARNVVASAARTTTGASDAIDLERRSGAKVALAVDVTDVTGVSPTLDLEVEWSHDGTTWFAAETADTLTQITAATTVVKQFDVKAPKYRVAWTIGGTTPSFTFSVDEHLA